MPASRVAIRRAKMQQNATECNGMQHILGLHQPYYERSAPSLFEWLLDASAALRHLKPPGYIRKMSAVPRLRAMIRRRHVQSYAVFALQDSGALPKHRVGLKNTDFLKAIKS